VLRCIQPLAQLLGTILLASNLAGCGTSERASVGPGGRRSIIPIETSSFQVLGGQSVSISDERGVVLSRISIPPVYGNAMKAYVTVLIDGTQRGKFLIDT